MGLSEDLKIEFEREAMKFEVRQPVFMISYECREHRKQRPLVEPNTVQSNSSVRCVVGL